jgi:hypothetical protein
VKEGHYFIKIRYGTAPAYYYSKGDEFDVRETATAASSIAITLHKVVSGNYGSKPITEAEFDSGKTEVKPVVKAAWQKDPKLFVKEIQAIVDREGLSPDKAVSQLISTDEPEVEWPGKFSLLNNFGRPPAVVEVEMNDLIVWQKKTNEYRIQRIGLLPSSEELKQWENLNRKLKNDADPSVVFRTRLIQSPITQKCNGLIVLEVIRIDGAPTAIFSVEGCRPKNQSDHYHIGLATKGAELMKSGSE